MKKNFCLCTILLLTIGLAASSPLWAKKSKKKNGEEMTKYYLTTGLMLRKTVDIQATADEAFNEWTTVKGVKTFFTPEAEIELAVHGKYEMYFDPKQPKGSRGSEGCEILSFVPGQMLSFTWNAPPAMPDVRKERTWVVLQFQDLGNKKSRVSLIHLGWQAGEQWQDALKYFDKAWDIVLGRLQYRFQTAPINWKKPFTPEK